MVYHSACSKQSNQAVYVVLLPGLLKCVTVVVTAFSRAPQEVNSASLSRWYQQELAEGIKP